MINKNTNSVYKDHQDVIYYEGYSNYSTNNLQYFNDLDASTNFVAAADPATFTASSNPSGTKGEALYSDVNFNQQDLYIYLRFRSSNYEIFTRTFGLFFQSNSIYYKMDITSTSTDTGYFNLHNGTTPYTLQNGLPLSSVPVILAWRVTGAGCEFILLILIITAISVSTMRRMQMIIFLVVGI